MTRRLLVLCLAAVAVALPAAAAPRIAVDLATYEFGDVVEGLSVEHTFVLTNTGDADLVIGEVQVSCGCTTTSLPTNRLAPGQSVGLHALVDTSGYSGTIRKAITVNSNDPTRPQLQVGFLGNVVRKQAYHETVGDLYYGFQLLIDVRDPSAFAGGHLIGAINIPLGDVQSQAGLLPTDMLSFVYDQDGQSVSSAVTAFERGGLTSVYAVRGGLDLWTRTYGTVCLITGQDSAWGTFPAAATQGRSANTSAVQQMEVSKLKGYFYILIDLRTPTEYAAGHLAGALNVQEGQVSGLLSTLPTDVPIYFYSKNGSVSDRVVTPLWQRGNMRVKSLLGGIDEWLRQRGEQFVVVSSG
jgi:rhodanese-related sulfurtransferase